VVQPQGARRKGGSRWSRRPKKWRALVQIFPDADYDDLVRRLKSDKPSYLRKRVLPEEANHVFALGEPALEFPRENQRYYPQGSLAANVLGFVDLAGKGHVGMEQVLEPRLLDPAQRANPWRCRSMRARRGRWKTNSAGVCWKATPRARRASSSMSIPAK
jgi:cell division protein FtsI (penicillin-binding protein 3)